ncbi:hypothetical protein CEXT_492261 [Caerostris extrusa]|uniref:Uncharacterized protein n=1 Tax=Caerostris extrusa TaxID=172846 RepID=A0AAV4TQ93_CAEEX|nr:hypothetical protein CEXT_492261 [Caerostris extrusa]
MFPKYHEKEGPDALRNKKGKKIRVSGVLGICFHSINQQSRCNAISRFFFPLSKTAKSSDSNVTPFPLDKPNNTQQHSGPSTSISHDGSLTFVTLLLCVGHWDSIWEERVAQLFLHLEHRLQIAAFNANQEWGIPDRKGGNLDKQSSSCKLLV